MPKPKSSAEDLESKKRLPELLETDLDDRDEAVMLLEQLNQLQVQVGKKPDEKKNKEGSGLLKQIQEVKTKLSVILAMSGLNGLRHGSLVFSDCWVDGRPTLDVKALKIELASEGVDLELLNRCIEKCTKTGDGYLRRQLVNLDRKGAGLEDYD